MRLSGAFANGFVLLVLSASLGACGGGDAATTPDTSDGTMAAKINAAAWVGSLGVTATMSAGTLTLIGNDDNFTKVQFTISGVGTPGTYQVGAATANSAQVTVGSSEVWVASATNGGSGSIVVTTLSATHATGTFSFSALAKAGSQATGTRNVTEGTFDVKLD